MFIRWLNLKKAKKSVLLLGPRRAGKSTYLKTNFKEYRYVTLDDLDELEHSKKDPKGWVERLGSKFIIDEAQRNPDLAIAVKWAIDEKHAHCILTGSTGLNLLDKGTETLAGRIQIFHLPPACFGENFGTPLTLNEFRKEYGASRIPEREFNVFKKYGGFPEVISCEEGGKAELLSIYKNSYFTRDVAQLNQIENVEGLRALYLALIRGLGSRYEVSSLLSATGLSTPTVKKYLNTLVQSGLMFKLYGYHLSETKRHMSSAKSYFIDVGILGALSSDFSSGQLIESFVVSEIEKRRRLGFIKTDVLYYYESAGGREVDLIYEEENLVTAIEIKSTKNISARDLRSLREFSIKSPKRLRKIIYYTGDEYAIDGENADIIEIRPIISLFRVGTI
jgi:hypothetical protein